MLSTHKLATVILNWSAIFWQKSPDATRYHLVPAMRQYDFIKRVFLDSKLTLLINIRLRGSHSRSRGCLGRGCRWWRLGGCSLDADADVVVQEQAAAVCLDCWVPGVAEGGNVIREPERIGQTKGILTTGLE